MGEALGVRAAEGPYCPVVKDADWVHNPIDAFILAELGTGRTATGPAGRQADAGPPRLFRRHRPAAHERAGRSVSRRSSRPMPGSGWSMRCLASPHYGEHWARHWLDLVRFAETNSFERDGLKPNAWRYRDYVIRSFNDDKPYDQFVREQLAGDELDEVTDDSIIATGYYRLGMWDDEPADPLQARYDELRRHRLHDQPGDAGPDGRLRPLPRSQDRSDSAGRLLRPAGVLRRRDAVCRYRRARSEPQSANGIMSKPAGACQRARRCATRKIVDPQGDAGHRRGRHQADVGRRSGDQPHARSASSCCNDKLRAAPERVGMGPVSGDAQATGGGARGDREAAAPESALGAGQVRTASRADARSAARQSARAGRRGRAALSRTVRRRGAGDSAGGRRTPARPAAAACWPSGSPRRGTCSPPG